MVASAEHLLKENFGKSLADRDVHILDPFTGTGNFIVNIMRQIPKTALPHKFAEELHCNEIMLLPYYVASMNIEHAYYEATGKYAPFEGIVLVDTFRTLDPPQTEFAFLSEKNTERVERQKRMPIRVVIANPPYNAWQADENDNNRNEKYVRIDERVKETYSKDSQAQNKNSLSDPYVKAFRYASDKISDCGVVAYVTNGAFVDSMSCDGMRKNLAREFDAIYLLDLGGNVRRNPKLSGTTHNVFGIQVGVCVTLLVKQPGKSKDAPRAAKIYHYAVPVDWRREQKYEFLEAMVSAAGIKWKTLKPDKKENWLDLGLCEEFDEFLPIGGRDVPASTSFPPIFFHYSRGIATSRDDTVINFSQETLAKNTGKMILAYNEQVAAYHRLKKKPIKVEDFIDYESGTIAWSRDLKNDLLRHRKAEFNNEKVRPSLYRPFTRSWLFFDRIMNEEVYGFPEIFPKLKTENRAICLTDAGSEKPFMLLATDRVADLHLVGAGASTQCFPLYTYTEEAAERRNNITDEALKLFVIFYDTKEITREDVFHYVYAILHHPAYRSAYAENLKRELPRIPFVGKSSDSAPAVFHPATTVANLRKGKRVDYDPAFSIDVFEAMAAAGKKLVNSHINYEAAKEYKLKRIENKDLPLDWRVEAMKLSKDKSAIVYNDFLTLSGIPPEALDYKLGNRSAVEWVIDQYRVTRDEKGQIANDPNRPDDEQYILRLLGQVITVSLETQKIINSMPQLNQR